MKGGVETTVGYKEWVAVCGALGSGRQCVLLRKGGIREGREGFSFKHERFYLFPTRFHAQAEQVRISCDSSLGAGEWQVGERVTVQFWCESMWATTLTRWEAVQQLEPFHIWSEELVRERFDCGDVQQIHCALVRVHALPQPWMIPYEKKYGGCRTWVNLPGAPANGPDQAAVLSDEGFAESRAAIEQIVGVR